jgi:hypothetical protein
LTQNAAKPRLGPVDPRAFKCFVMHTGVRQFDRRQPGHLPHPQVQTSGAGVQWGLLAGVAEGDAAFSGGAGPGVLAGGDTLVNAGRILTP